MDLTMWILGVKHYVDKDIIIEMLKYYEEESDNNCL